MDNTVIIFIKGNQTDVDGSEETFEFVTHGTLQKQQNDAYCISYKETEVTGLEGTTTTFLIENQQITMSRSGALKSEMVFCEGEQHLSLYETEVGSLTINVSTHKACSDIDFNGGTLELQYIVHIEDQMIGKNTFHIQVKKAEM